MSCSTPLRREAIESPIGVLWVVTGNEDTLLALDWEERREDQQVAMIRKFGESPKELNGAATPSSVATTVHDYFAGDLDALSSVKIAISGTSFQERVWTVLRTIPARSTVSYGTVAALIGMPSACRAVGAAVGSNPVPLVTPCHRVIGADGSITGFGGGMERKRWLLRHENHFGLDDRQHSMAFVHAASAQVDGGF